MDKPDDIKTWKTVFWMLVATCLGVMLYLTWRSKEDQNDNGSIVPTDAVDQQSPKTMHESDSPPVETVQIPDHPNSATWLIRDPEDQTDPRSHFDYGDVTQDGWCVVAGSVRGKSHAHDAKWREDSFQIKTAKGCQIVAVSDGAGSAEYSRVGSDIATRTSISVISDCLTALAHAPSEKDLVDSVHSAIDAAYSAVFAEAQKREIPVRQFACTLLLLIHQPNAEGAMSRIASFQVGDGAIFIEREGSIDVIDEGDHGISGGETRFLTSVQRESLYGRITLHNHPSPPRMIVVATDGVADDFYPYASKAGMLIKGIRENVLDNAGESWEQSLRELLDYEKKGSFDDRTLAILAAKPTVATPLP